jgi:hypothetical protein
MSAAITPLCACGAPAVLIDPGHAPEFAPGGIAIDTGRPVSGRCMRCWPAARGVQQLLFDAVGP